MNETLTPRRTYFFVFVALLVLLALTVGAAFLDLGILNPILTLVIAVTKALLVALFFMEVRHSTTLMRVFVIAGLLWLSIMLFPILSDYIAHAWLSLPGG